MPAPRSQRRARLAALVSVTLALTGLQFFVAPAVQANPDGTALVISEVYGGGGNTGAQYTHDFIELYNPTGAPISVDGWSVQGRSATNSAAATAGANITPLTGSVPAGGYYLVREGAGAGNGVALPTPNATGTMGIAAGGWQIWLANTTTGLDPADGNVTAAPNPAIIDLVGAATNSNSFETATANEAPSNTLATTRNASNTDTDNNANDFSTAAPAPVGAGPAALSLTNPGPQTSTVGVAISTLQLVASGGTTPYTYGETNLPAGLSLDMSTGAITGTPTTAGTPSVTVSVTDSAGVPATDNKTFTWTVNAAPVDVTPIKDIQGTGATTPLSGTVMTEGEVTARYPTGGLNGFYIQTPGADTADASDAIFVYGGPGGFTTYPAIGDSVRVTGTPGEFSGQTQLTSTDSDVAVIADLPGTVTPKTQVPGTDCALPGTGCLAGAALDTAREVAEGEAFQPTAPWTATDVYDGSPFVAGGSFSSSMFGEIGVAAESTLPLVSPTEVIDAQSPAKADRIKYNDAHRITLDDGSSTNYTSAANTGLPFPWYAASHFPRVGSSVTFPAPVVFTFGFGAWRILPTTRVVGAPTATQPQLSQTRAANAAPQDVGGDIQLATFNVLNFFPTTGEEFVAMGGGRTCTYFNDREGNPITNNNCAPNGPRGAANNENLVRQRDKIVAAINTADADIVSLEELENSVHYGKPRDFAIDALVTALNADAGPGTWAAVPSPDAADLPPLSEQDVIRNGFIYKPATVALVGGSVVLADESTGTEAFADAREPLAQAFKAVGSPDSDAFAVIVNHFKSKGSGTPDPDGQGNANDRRILQANSLVAFADEFKALRGITRVFLAGDFNAYSEEDPIQVLEAAGYNHLESTSDPDEESYNFDGQIGSLDHVLANPAALTDVEDVDIWTINGYESVYYEYSRYNYNVTNLYQPDQFKSSDHNPEIIGINVPVEPAVRDIQILGTNDFHGRIAKDPVSAAAGAGVLAGAVNQLRATNPDTVFAAAGDLIGASTFESFILNDKPTIDALNEAGLEVSAVGNHEFDQGYDDLVDRVMAEYDPTDNPEGGAEWAYLGANVRFRANDNPALPATWTKDFGSVRVGFVGVVTEHLPELVSPGGIEEIKVTDIVTETNSAADDLVNSQGADIVVMLVHEGAPNTNCATMDDDPTSDFGSIITGVNDNVDAIVSGHTHLEYNCSFPVPGWSTRPVTDRPVVSAGQYGAALNKIVFTVDTATGEVQSKTQNVVKLKTCAGTGGTACGGSGQPPWVEAFPTDAETQEIVDDAVAESAVLGAVPLGQIAGPIRRGYLANGTTENRGVESTLGNLVAEAQRWQTSGAEAGSAQIAFMNPGGLRTDMLGVGSDPYPRTLTYKQAAEVQPFANGLVNMDLTGAQIKAALEQQWQPGGASRPFLKLGASKGFTYTSDPDAAAGSRITGMWLDGVAIVPTTVYSVTVNGFLSTGGDNFTAFVGGANKAEAGLTDLQAMVNYMAEFANTDEGDPPLPVPTKQNGVHVNFPAGAPASYDAGQHVTFDVSGWSFSNAADPKDTDVVVKLGAATLGTFPLNNTIQATLPGFDGTGTAAVDVVVPDTAASGPMTLTLVGATTGTEMPVTVQVGKAASTVAAPDVSVEYGQPVPVQVTVTGPGATPTGSVQLFDGATLLGSAALNAGGTATITVPAKTFPVGSRSLTVVYSGDATHLGDQASLTVTVSKAGSTTSAQVTPQNPTPNKKVELKVTVVGNHGIPATGQVTVTVDGKTLTKTLKNGRLSLDLGKFRRGTYEVEVVYLGSSTVAGSMTTVTFTVS